MEDAMLRLFFVTSSDYGITSAQIIAAESREEAVELARAGVPSGDFIEDPVAIETPVVKGVVAAA